jgi:putative membrane protein
MKRIILMAGLACVLALPGSPAAQSGTPSGQGAKPGGQTGSGSSGSGQGSTAGASSGQKSKPTPTSGKEAAGSALAATDRTFVMEAAHGGLAEVELGRMAASKATNADVKQFGQRMVDDHSKANDELKSLASKKSVTLPAETDAKHKADMARIEKLTGAAFDKAYMAHMVADHNKDVAAFQRASTAAKDPDLKAWAGKTLPTLKEHQTMAKEVNGKLGGASTAKPAAKKQ